MNTQQNRVVADGPQVHQAEVSKQTNEEVEEQEMLAMVSEFECADLLENSVETATARITQCMGEVRLDEVWRLLLNSLHKYANIVQINVEITFLYKWYFS